MLNNKLVLRTALMVMIVLSFAIGGGGRVFADDAGTTKNAVAADNSADQSAAVAPASVNPDPSINNDQSNTTPDSGTPPSNVVPPADPSAGTPTTDTSTTGSDNQTPPTPAPPTCTVPTGDPNQASQPASNPSATGQTNTTDNLGINNNICGDANSGNAGVTGNTNGGNATTGNADSEATIMNVIQSITGLSGANLATFVKNIGDYTGDITLDPTTLSSALGIGCSLCGGNGLNSNVNSNINNNINLGANSGNADVSNNGSGGNATTGNATALLNLINIINSIIASQQSFIGIVNINGNLNGDILLPPDMLAGLMGSNPPPTGSGGSSELNANTNEGINNNINLSATSGNADVSGNGSGGNATTGNAQTKLTLLNLTGSQIIGQNAILVFVNVLGTWVGMIVNAPAGTTSAALGDANSTGGGCGCSGANLNTTTNSQITNNINLTAKTGDASVTGNGSGGNATSGNATASANIVNIINSDIALTGWFGILFINVFGSWTGSFGIDTSAGDPPVLPPSGDSGSSQGASDAAATTTSGGQSGGFSGGETGGGTQTTTTDDNNQNSVLGAFTAGGSGPLTDANHGGPNILVGIAGGLCCFMLLGLVERRQKKHGQQFVPVAPELLTNQWQ